MVEKVRRTRNEATNKDDERLPWPKAILRGGTTMCLATEELRFIDVMCFAGPGVKLDTFIRAYNPGGEVKLKFPYEILRSPKDLYDIVEFPPKEAFFSTLKLEQITEAEYDEAKALWDAMPVKNLYNYIRIYNCADVSPFLRACVNMQQIFRDDLEVELFKQFMSVPGCTANILFTRLRQHHPCARFGLFDETQADLCQELYSNRSLVGGLSTIVTRKAVAGETPIRGNSDNIVERILGFDFNALYLFALTMPMPTGNADYWVVEKNQFHRKSLTEEQIYKNRRCHGEVEYLKFAAFRDNTYIRHAAHGKQTQLGVEQYKIDGYAKEAKRVYDYRGCYYHYHDVNCLNPKLDLSKADRSIMDKDAEKERSIGSLGFELVVTYECRFKMIKKTATAIRKNQQPLPTNDATIVEEARTYNRYLEKYPRRKFYNKSIVPYQAMINAIVQGDVFGFVCCDVDTPDELKGRYEDMPLIIKHAMVGRDDIGEMMLKMAVDKKLLETPRDCLIASHHGERLWIMTPLLKYMLEEGVQLKRVHQLAVYDSERTFQFFGDLVTEMRKRGDSGDQSQKLLADIYKLLGNSGYGKCLTRVDRHRETFYTDGQEMQDLHNDPLFYRSKQISENTFEASKFKKTVAFNLPMQIGLAVYSYAKLRVLEFITRVLQRFVPKSKYAFLESDTDSIYLALATKTFREAVSPELMEEFLKIEPDWFVMDPKTQQRQPGLLKIEKIGKSYVGLCSKLYIVVPEDDDPKWELKVVSKGVQIKRNAAILVFENYNDVLENRPSAQTTAINIGIRELNGEMCTYVQRKLGLTAFNIKRICLPDHTTLPLDI